MSTPINLNKVRKDRARSEKKERADQNVVAYGRSKLEKQATKIQNAKAKRMVDNHKRDQ
ncbi:MAG: DUF4169 family protein [Sulfitobacter sp.]